jgi:hypothetical protein
MFKPLHKQINKYRLQNYEGELKMEVSLVIEALQLRHCET